MPPEKSFFILPHCNQPYKKQYIIDNYDATRRNIIDLTLACETNQRYVYKVIEELVKGKKDGK